MGCRVHVIKKHAEYGASEYFNWQAEEFSYLLGSLGCEVCSEDEFITNNFECDKGEYKKALKLVKADVEKGDCPEVRKKFGNVNLDYGYYKDCVEQLGGKDKVLEAMEAFLAEADKKSRWISFSAW